MKIKSMLEINKSLIGGLFLLLIIINSPISGQEIGFPFIENIPPAINGFRDPNYSISIDSRGFLYVGNQNAIIEYDGENWREIDIKGFPLLCSSNKGKVYVAGFNSFGSLQPDQKGLIGIKNLKNFDDSIGFGQPNSICIYGRNIYFSTKSSLYHYGGDSITQIINKQPDLRLFKLQTEVLVYTVDGGLMNVFVCDLRPHRFNKSLYGRKVDGLAQANNGLLIVSKNSTYIINDDTIRSFSPEINGFLKKNTFNGVLNIKDGKYIFYTQKGGMAITDEQGAIINVLNKKTGLYDNCINDVLPDRQNNLWLAFNNGISRIEYPSAFSYFNFNNGIKGRVSSIKRHKDILYVSTSSGVFFYNKEDNSFDLTRFQKVKGIESGGSTFFVVDNRLFACTDNGLYEISYNVANKVVVGNFSRIQKSRLFKNKFYFIEKSNILIYSYEKEWRYEYSIDGFKSDITSIAEDVEHENIWIGTLFSGLYSMEGSFSSKSDTKLKKHVRGEGLPSELSRFDVFETSKGILFSSQEGIFRYDYIYKRFVLAPDIDVKFENGKCRTYPIVEDSDGNLWMNSGSPNKFERQIAVAWNVKGVSKYTYISQPFNVIKDFNCEAIYPDTNFVVWFGGYDGLIRLDFKMLQEDSLASKTYIRKITLTGDSVLFHSTEYNTDLSLMYKKIRYSDNSLKFDFATPIYNDAKYVLHQYKLDGYNKDWSNFSKSNSKEYTNLPPGRYVFRVRAKDVFERYSEDAIFRFQIQKPMYVTWYAFIFYAFIIISIIVLIVRRRSYQFAKEKFKLENIIAERTEELLKEKEKTERLLANILPEQTVEELKDKGKASSMRFNVVSVLFSDIQGFTQIAEEMKPDQLVNELDKFFLQFDRIVEKYNIEKIKTIGDAYMCAGGIPNKNRTNPLEVLIAALEILQYVQQRKAMSGSDPNKYWGLRIGIHTGPVVAGVIGSKKFTYDIWGDSVNIASRMESSGEVDKINISENTYQFVKKYFDCTYRGKMPVKNKGNVDMYFVNGLKQEYCKNGNVYMPNDKFFYKLKRYRFEDLEDYLLDRMEKELPETLYYHNIKHTIDVIVQAEIIGRGEGVSEEELLLLKTAALFHDAGFVVSMKDHEIHSIQLAGEILPKFKYTEEQIVLIGDLIYATKIPHNPKTKLEEIICDADLDYLGRTDYIETSRNLYKELVKNKMLKRNEIEWNRFQIRFLEQHRYFTDTEKTRRNYNKNKQLQNIIEINMKLEARNG